MKTLMICLLLSFVSISQAGTVDLPLESTENSQAFDLDQDACAKDQRACPFVLKDGEIQFQPAQAGEMMAANCADECFWDQQCDSYCGAPGAGACIVTFPSGCPSFRRVCACTF